MQTTRTIPVLFLLACSPATSVDISTDDHDVADEVEPASIAIRDAAPAFDPVDGTTLPFTVETQPGYAIHVEVRRDGEYLASWDGESDTNGLFAATWDGRHSDGSAVGSGAFQIVAEVESPVGIIEATHDVYAVRAAFKTAWAEDDDGFSADRHEMYWGADGTLQDAGLDIAHIDAIELDGNPQDLPPVTDVLVRAPEVETEPVAYTWDSRPILTLELGTETVLGSTGLAEADVDLELDGWTVLSGNPLRDGVPVTMQADEALVEGPGIHTVDLSLRFTSTDTDGATWDVGDQILPMRFYMTMGPSGFTRELDKYRPWALVLDESLAAVDGAEPNDNAVLDALVEWIFNDLGLVYDSEAGASFYSDYAMWQWDRPHFFLGEFLLRQNGSVINCSDAANILSAYANMTGVALNQLVILDNFDLNQIKAIGGNQYSNCPFGPWGCGFSYHAVTSTDGGNTIWDATLALDGDQNPGQLPSSELMVQSISGQEYLSRLVKSGQAAYTNNAEGTLQ